MVCPVVNADVGIHRKATSPATSEGSPTRPSGVRLTTSSKNFASLNTCPNKQVSSQVLEWNQNQYIHEGRLMFKSKILSK
jgi:hypothetical protein